MPKWLPLLSCWAREAAIGLLRVREHWFPYLMKHPSNSVGSSGSCANYLAGREPRRPTPGAEAWEVDQIQWEPLLLSPPPSSGINHPLANPLPFPTQLCPLPAFTHCSPPKTPSHCLAGNLPWCTPLAPHTIAVARHQLALDTPPLHLSPSGCRNGTFASAVAWEEVVGGTAWAEEWAAHFIAWVPEWIECSPQQETGAAILAHEVSGFFLKFHNHGIQ